MALYVASGTYTGDGSNDRNIPVSPSFAIKYVMIKGNRSATYPTGTAWMSISGMGDSAFIGASNDINRADYIQSMGTGTFQIGTLGGVNENTIVYNYFCLGGDDTEIFASTYIGTGVDGAAITGVPFQPELVITKGSGADNGYANMRFGTTGDSSQFFGDVQNLANYIQSLTSDGFTVGTGNSVNNAAVTYYYLAVRSVNGQTKVGSYTGNATDPKDITDVGFQPELAWVKADSGSFQLSWTDTGHTADTTSYPPQNSANFANGIQSFLSNGFQLGSDTKVNNSGTTYYYYAVKNAAASASVPFLPLLGVG